MAAAALKGKTALVTGAARRLGRAIALALADAGVNVVVHYHNSEAEAETLREELASRGVKAWRVEADFSSPAATNAFIPRIFDATGTLDFLVNSASLFLPGTLLDVTAQELARDMQVNVWAPFLLSREFFRRARTGKIVNLLDSRIAGQDRSHASYLFSKRAFATLTEMMALEFAPDMAVNGVAPGLILPPQGKDQDYLNKLAKSVPLRRHGTASDVADAVLYLLGGDFVTGHVLFVDGGQHLMENCNGQDFY